MSHINSSIYELIEIILKEQFSEDVFNIARDILNNGSSSILDIVKRMNLDFLSVRNALIILLQNKLLKFQEVIRKDTKEYVYEIEIHNLLNLLRFPKILYFISQIFGENAVLIFEEFMQFGILSAGQCIEQIIFKLQSNKKNNLNYYNNIRSVFLKMVEENYIAQVNKLKTQELKKKEKPPKGKGKKKGKSFLKDPDENTLTLNEEEELKSKKKSNKKSSNKESTKDTKSPKKKTNSKKVDKKPSENNIIIEKKIVLDEDESLNISEHSEEDEEENMVLPRKSKSLLDDVVDDHSPLIYDQIKEKYYYFYINFEKILNEMKVNLIVEMISQSINPQAGLILQAILQNNFQYSVKNGKSSPFTANQILREVLVKNPKSQLKLNKIIEIMTSLIEEHEFALKWGFDDNNNTLYCVNFECIANKLKTKYLERIIEQQFSPMHLRVYRLLSKCGALDSKNIMELCLLPQKECTAYLNQMIQECFVETQTINSKGSNVIYYSINNTSNIEYMIVKIYKIIRNLKIFLNKEIERIKNLESQFKQEEYVNKVYGSISELDDTILILNINN